MYESTPSILQLQAICSEDTYKNTKLCKIINAYGSDEGYRDIASAASVLLNTALGKNVPRLIVSAGPLEHWQDSIRHAFRYGLLPWACGFTLTDSILNKQSKRGGAHYGPLLDELARSFVKRDSMFEIVPPIIIYYATNGGGVIGFGFAIWADVSPLRAILWSREKCPPSTNASCYTVRWYTLPIALGCEATEYVASNPKRCAIDKVIVTARSCAQSISKNYQAIVKALLDIIKNDSNYIKNAFKLVSLSLKKQLGKDKSVEGALQGGSSGIISPATAVQSTNAIDDDWRKILGKHTIRNNIVKRIYNLGVHIPRELIEIVAFLIADGNVMLIGPPGYGKTLLARIIADVSKSELIPATCHAGWTRADFIGGPYLRKGSIAWRSGYLVRAVARALQGRRTLLLLDEVNRAEVDKVFGEFFTLFPSPSAEDWNLEGLCDIVCEETSEDERDEPARILCSACGDRDNFRRHVKGLLRVVATLNTVDYATVFSLGEAFARRFYKVEFLVPSDVNHILNNEIQQALASIAGTHSKLKDFKDFREALSMFAKFVAELRKARGEVDVAGVLVTQLPVGPAFVKEVVTLAYRMLDANIVEDPLCAIVIAIEASVPVTVLVEEDSRERLRRALVSVFGNMVEKCGRSAGRP